jgi:hypothetical protein
LARWIAEGDEPVVLEDARFTHRVPTEDGALLLAGRGCSWSWFDEAEDLAGICTDDLQIIQVESAVSRFRDTSKNYANYIPILRYWEPVAEALSRVGSSKSEGEDASDIGRRRLAYNDVLLNRLRDQVAKGEDRPCIQGAVLRDAESATLTREELISVSLSMMAVSEAESTRI